MDEYISRQEAIKALYEVYEHDYPTASGNFDEYARHDVRNVLNGLPSADVQPVRYGKWVKSNTQKHVEVTYECSECQHEVVGEYEKTPFCGGCGARMEGDSNE